MEVGVDDLADIIAGMEGLDLWLDFREALQFAGLSFTWWRKSQDRAGWRAAATHLICRLGGV